MSGLEDVIRGQKELLELLGSVLRPSSAKFTALHELIDKPAIYRRWLLEFWSDPRNSRMWAERGVILEDVKKEVQEDMRQEATQREKQQKDEVVQREKLRREIRKSALERLEEDRTDYPEYLDGVIDYWSDPEWSDDIDELKKAGVTLDDVSRIMAGASVASLANIVPSTAVELKQVVTPIKLSHIIHTRPLSYLEYKLAEVKYVAWPVTLTEHVSSHYNKRVYIFGDIHRKESRCPPDANDLNRTDLSQFISDLIKLVDPSPVDVWLETTYLSKTETREKSDTKYNYVDQIEEDFETCLRVQKGVCKIPNARLHYTDVRNVKIPAVDDLGMLSITIRGYISRRDDKTLTPEDRSLYLEYYIDDIKKERWSIDEGIDEKKWMSMLKIDKQLANIPEPEVRAAIENQFLPLLRVNLPTKAGLDEAIAGITATVPNDAPSQVLDLKISDFRVALMDLYLAGRMFRTFHDKKNPSVILPRGDKDIIYVGDFHANGYRKLLNTLGFTQVNKSESIDETGPSYQCIDVTGFAPYFQQIVRTSTAVRGADAYTAFPWQHLAPL